MEQPERSTSSTLPRSTCTGGAPRPTETDKPLRWPQPITSTPRQANQLAAEPDPEAIHQHEDTMSNTKNSHDGPRKSVSVEIGGVADHGHYHTDRRMIRVDYRELSKATQVGGSPPPVLARLILAELVREAPDE